MRSLYSVLTAVPTRLESLFMILVGFGISVYGLKAHTFREDARLHMLTPIDKLEEYEPRWYQRLFYVAAGVFLIVGGIAGIGGLWKR